MVQVGFPDTVQAGLPDTVQAGLPDTVQAGLPDMVQADLPDTVQADTERLLVGLVQAESGKEASMGHLGEDRLIGSMAGQLGAEVGSLCLHLVALPPYLRQTRPPPYLKFFLELGSPCTNTKHKRRQHKS